MVFTSIEALEKHKRYCYEEDAVRMEVPEPGTTISFKNYVRSMRVPFVIYADFESSIKPIDICQPTSNEFYTKKIHKHIPISFVMYVKNTYENVYKSRIETFTAKSEDDDVGQIFIDQLEQILKSIYVAEKRSTYKYKST